MSELIKLEDEEKEEDEDEKELINNISFEDTKNADKIIEEKKFRDSIYIKLKNEGLKSINIDTTTKLRVILEFESFNFNYNYDNFKFIKDKITMKFLLENNDCIFFKKQLHKKILKYFYFAFKKDFFKLKNKENVHIILLFDYKYDDLKFIDENILLVKTYSGGNNMFHLYEKNIDVIKLVDKEKLCYSKNFNNKNFLEINRDTKYINEIFKYCILDEGVVDCFNFNIIQNNFDIFLVNHINEKNKKLFNSKLK